MFARIPTSTNARPVPNDWTESVGRLLEKTYHHQCKEKGVFFDIYARVYDQELLVIVSLLSEKDQSTLPVTCFLSCSPDDISNAKKVKETQDNYIELLGLFFDEIFANEDWDEYEPVWQEVELKNKNYFWKITRENIALTLEADRLLGNEFKED